MAVRDGKLMQDLELESLCNGVGHSQRVLDHPIANDSGSRDCVKLPSPTAVFRLIDTIAQEFFTSCLRNFAHCQENDSDYPKECDVQHVE